MNLVFAKQGLYTANATRETTSALCQLCNGFQQTAATYIKGKYICTNIHLFTNFSFDYTAIENENSQ